MGNKTHKILVYITWGIVFIMVFLDTSIYASSQDAEWLQGLVGRHQQRLIYDQQQQILSALEQAKKEVSSPLARQGIEQVIIRRKQGSVQASAGTPLPWKSNKSSISAMEQAQEEKNPSTTRRSSTTRAMRNEKQANAGDKNPLTSSSSTTTSEIKRSSVLIQEMPIVADIYQLEEGTVDISRLQSTWLSWVNDLRGSRGRSALRHSIPLHKTAADRSETMKKKKSADHKRFADSGYYDYAVIEQWFRDRGIEFENISRATFTENVGRATFRCDQYDCTDIALEGLRRVFAYYVAEEGTTYDAHRKTLIHPLFQVVGLGIAIDEQAGQLYVTTHYGTQIKYSK